MSENCAKVIRIITLPQVLVFFLILLLGDQIPPWHHEMAIVLLCVVPLISYLYWHISPELREQGRKSQRKLAIIFSVIGYVLGTVYCIAFGGSKTELFMYKPTSAVVTVDGVKHTYKHVWLAPTMNGRYYGGGMIPTPQQDRLVQPKQLSVMVFRSPGKLKALAVFPSIFKGEHIKHTDVVEVLTGQEITVQFDRPAPLQNDGETIPDVTTYRASACAEVLAER